MKFRSVLFAPSNQPATVRKMPRAAPDVCVLDLEDSVPARAKDEARSDAVALASELLSKHPGIGVFIRVNAPRSRWFESDLSAALKIGGIQGIFVPKLAYLDDIPNVGLPVVAGIESAQGLLELPRLLSGPIAAVYFGAEDYVADLGGHRTSGNLEVLYARSKIALHARLAGIQAIDQIVVDFRNDARFVQEACDAAAMGYMGKLCIHPRQVPLANKTFTPTPEEVSRSRQLLDIAKEMEGPGHGAFTFEGEMVDEALLKRARTILDRSAPIDPLSRRIGDI